MDAISGLVGMTAIVVAGLTTLGVFGHRSPRFSQLFATILVVYFLAVATLLAVAQLTSLAAGNLVVGLIVAGLTVVSDGTPRRVRDDQGRDDWGR